MKVLVTGLSGVVGQAIIEKLKDRYEVSALSRYGTPGIEKKNDFIGDILWLQYIYSHESSERILNQMF